MSKTKVSSFVAQFAATLKGDSDKAQAEKAWRQAQSALKTQIAALEGDTIAKEDAVTDAVENKRMARINYGKPMESSYRATYAANLIDADNGVAYAQDALDEHLAKIEFFKAELAALENEVEEEA